MDDARVDRLMEHLFGTGPDPVHAILDGARDPDVHPMVVRSELPHKCLFSGDLGKELAAAAPYLVQLKRRDGATRRLLARAWGQSWGIFLTSPSSMEDLRRHFRRFLRVKDARGKNLYFRYYDPRVLRAYLPTCTPGEIEAIFGPVLAYLMESADPLKILVARRGGRELVEWSGAAAS